MGFKSYAVSAGQDRGWILQEGLPVRFSGASGLVALWLGAHHDPVDRPWRVAPSEWLAMILPPAEARRRWIVFEQEEDGKHTCAQLLFVTGVVSRRVDLLFTLAPLVVVQPPGPHGASGGGGKTVGGGACPGGRAGQPALHVAVDTPASCAGSGGRGPAFGGAALSGAGAFPPPG